ncbi:AP-3 complex subunit delta [Lambiella insularis]|nr:AP-3 complex subunit delta [Lambiella insularis]
MDLKATALLKLIYLEMFGHDMSWASFNVLEVMSSPKYLQKRVGYLGAVQSFRSDTEVLMLATNLLKKDITSASLPTIALPLLTLPHIVTPSIALCLLTDLMPRLSHSSPSIRKKSVVTLYRLALVYPETLRPSWPRIKDMLMDTDEDPSVIAAIINVICELGWRRPRDFLPLAPRMFNLLVDGGNNWMAIKIIKLFAVLTPLEPRLVKKLLPPLMTLIRTTPAMSLLYECINGIVQGGILEKSEGIQEGDEVAELCVGKLRGMIAVEGDPNLKYVALLAFNKIVITHPSLVSLHQDVIMDCVEDADISIRLQALDLGSGMINRDNLTAVIDRLLRQLREANSLASNSRTTFDRTRTDGVEPAADSDGEDPEQILRSSTMGPDESMPVPDDYRITVIRQILAMCSCNTYANISDFEWYIDVLLELVRLSPKDTRMPISSAYNSTSTGHNVELSKAIGSELRNVAVRVDSVRPDAVRAAGSLLANHRSQNSVSDITYGGNAVLAYAAWIVGEYADLITNRRDTLDNLLLPTLHLLDSDVICAYVQAIPKILSSIIRQIARWTTEWQTVYSLLLDRIVYSLHSLTAHPSLEVQERSVEFFELMRLAAEAVKNHQVQGGGGPHFLTHVMPSLFRESELKPVAITAQRKVPIPDEIDLNNPISEKLKETILRAEGDPFMDKESAESDQFYYQLATIRGKHEIGIDLSQVSGDNTHSYQYEPQAILDPKVIALKRAERSERNKDVPFYIAHVDDSSSGATTPSQDTTRLDNGHDLDIDSIPIMDLDVGIRNTSAHNFEADIRKPRRKGLQKVHVAPDENIDAHDTTTSSIMNPEAINPGGSRRGTNKRSLLEVDSSGIGNLRLNADFGNGITGQLDYERQEYETLEMAEAVAEVERLRLEMQRAAERIRVAEDIPIDGTLVKKKTKKKSSTVNSATGNLDVDMESAKSEDVVIKRKKKKKKRKILGIPDDGPGAVQANS